MVGQCWETWYEGGAAKEMVKSFLPSLKLYYSRNFFFSPLGGQFLFLVVKISNPLTSGSCAGFWLEV